MNKVLIILLTSLLVISCFYDLKTRKIPNAFNLLVLAICCSLGLYFYGFSAAISFLAISLGLMPLYLLGVFGGGDYKLFAAISFAIPLDVNVNLLLYASLWAAVYGFIKLLTFVDYKNFSLSFYLHFKNLFSSSTKSTNKIPLTIPYLLAWLSILKLGGIA